MSKRTAHLACRQIFLTMATTVIMHTISFLFLNFVKKTGKLIIYALLFLNFVSRSVRQMSSDVDVEVVRRQDVQVRSQVLKRNGVPSRSAGTTATTTGLHLDDLVHPDVARDRVGLVSNMVSPALLADSGRKLQELGCTGAGTSISVSSTVFPLMEGCFTPTLVDGSFTYTMATASIYVVESTSSTSEVSACFMNNANLYHTFSSHTHINVVIVPAFHWLLFPPLSYVACAHRKGI